MLVFGTYVLYPLFSSIALSFHEWDGVAEKAFVGLANYRELIHADTFYSALKNNLIWLVLFMLAVPAGLFIAIFLNQTVTGIRLYKSLFFFPFVISQVVIGLVFTWFYNPANGLFTQILAALGMPGVAVLSDERIAGFEDVPTAKEQGVDITAMNWRGIYVPKGISDEDYNNWVDWLKQVGDRVDQDAERQEEQRPERHAQCHRQGQGDDQPAMGGEPQQAGPVGLRGDGAARAGNARGG